MTRASDLAKTAEIIDTATYTFRNKIINGAMEIDQRNVGSSAGTASGTFVYFLDRWVGSYTQTSKFTVQQNAGSVTPPAGFTNYLGVTSSSAYSVLATDTFNIQQPIEGYNISDLSWGTLNARTVTVSFWVRSSLTGTFGGVVCNYGITRSYPFTYSISTANTWEYKTVTIPGDTTGTWSTNNSGGIRLYFNLGAGSTYSGTAGTWAGANYQSATGATSVVGTNGATWYITGVQLEVGSVATPFEKRNFQQELAMCQRYYSKSYNLSTAPGSATTVGTNQTEVPATGLSTVLVTVRFPVAMRATPTFTPYNDAGQSGYVQTNSTGTATPNIQNVGENSATCGASSSSWARFQWTASIEL